MREDLARPENSLVREFIVLPNERVSFGSGGKQYLAYYEETHANLQGMIDVLENNGLVADVTSGNTPIYRIDEELVGYLLRRGRNR